MPQLEAFQGYLSLVGFEQPSKPRPANVREDDTMPKLDGYLRITEAAEYLGVSPNSLRNWGRNGKFAEGRHSMSGYRLYAKEELDALLNATDRISDTEHRRRKPK